MVPIGFPPEYNAYLELMERGIAITVLEAGTASKYNFWMRSGKTRATGSYPVGTEGESSQVHGRHRQFKRSLDSKHPKWRMEKPA